MNYKESVLDLIGETPLLELKNIEKEYNLSSKIFAKIERMNPSGSIKDRAAKEIILDALNKNLINKDTIIVEPTSGNMGISLAMICASLSLKLRIYLPENMSKERILIMKAYGSEVILTPSSLGMKGAIKEAKEFINNNPNTFMPSQFDNFNNSLAHYKYTAKEIYDSLDGKIDLFVAGFGSGGTISGVSKYLKEKNKEIITIGVEPKNSSFILTSTSGHHKIAGIGAGFKPKILDLSNVDKVINVSDEEAYFYTKLLARKEGLFVGISSGANVASAINLAKVYKNKNIVTVLPDNGERYLSIDNLYE